MEKRFVGIKTQSINYGKYSKSEKGRQISDGNEEQTTKLPSDLFLWAALGSMAVSLTLKIMAKKHTALFVGQWAAPFLLIGIYNKLVKLEGHNQENKS